MGTAVALEAMKMMDETDYEAMVMEKGAYLLEGLEELKRRYKIVGDVDGLGMALRMEICEPHDSFTPSKAIVDRMVDEGLKGDLEVDGKKYGLVLDIGGYYKNVVTLAPSLHITKHEMDLSLQAARPRHAAGQRGVNLAVRAREPTCVLTGSAQGTPIQDRGKLIVPEQKQRA